MQKNTISANYGAFLALILLLFSQCGSKQQKPLPSSNLMQAIEQAGDGGMTAEEYHALKAKFGKMFDRWCLEVMDVAPAYYAKDSIMAGFLNAFVQLNKPVFTSVKKHYAKYPDLDLDIAKTMAKLKSEFPDAGEMQILVYFSQFSNTNTFTDTVNGRQVLAYSAEMFMDDTFALYGMIEGLPGWIKRYARTEQIAPYLAATYLNGRYAETHPRKTMLDEMVFQGKLWYSMAKLCPDISEAHLFGYTDPEWKFLNQEEANVWNYYVQQQTLFSTDFNHVIKRFFIQGEKTTGAGLPEECPPRIGNFSGYKVIAAYAAKTGKSLKQIWEENNSGNILQQSGYNPIR
jgi:hypothetical protein